MKTTVEWLEHMLLIILNEEEFKKITFAIEQAKEMEKQQIIAAMDICQRTDFYVKYESSEQYYNETFNK